MTDRWQQYFAQHGAFDRSWLRSAAMHWSFHEALYGVMLRHCPPPARILDVGCGPGWSDLYLASAGYEVTGIDSEARLVDAARSFSDGMQVPATFEVGDATDLRTLYGRFDLVYSCGVLEHFDRDETVRLLAEQARCAPRVLIQIPSRYTSYAAEIADERIYSISQLERIVRDAGLTVSESFGYGEITVTSGQVWLRRLLPRLLWRWLQNRGFAFSIAVLGMQQTR